MKNKYKQMVYGTSTLAVLVGIISCGEINDTNKTYKANLTTVNALVAPTVVGTGSILIEKDNLTANVGLSQAPLGTHMQSITVGAACPTASDDTNADGYIDAVEAQAIAGKIIVPLDGDLSSQEAGADTYPVDNYSYSQSTSFARMVSDLVLPDPNPDDSIVKLSTNDELTFQGKVIMVHGVPPETVLPATVQSIDGMPATTSIPIACGVIQREGEDGTATTTGGATTGESGTTTGETGTTTGGTTTGETTTGETGTTTGETGTTTGTTTGETSTTTTGGETTGDSGTTTGGTTTTTGGATGII